MNPPFSLRKKRKRTEEEKKTRGRRSMATNPRRKASFSGRFRVISQRPSFFVVVSSAFVQGQKIPYSFMRKYGRDLQDMVLLKVPTGASWQVELFHSDDSKTLLKNGWKEFAEYYSIKNFYFLIFNYRGNFQFDVFIFDLSATEIEYRVKTDREEHGRRSNYCRTFEEDFEEISSQILDKQNRKTPAASKGKKRLAVEDLEEDVYVEISDDDDDDDNDDLPQPSSREVSREHPRLKGKKNPLKFQPNLTEGQGTIRDKSRFKSYKMGKAFTSSNPFFTSFMQPSFVSKKFYLEIPKKFVARYLYKNKKRDNFRLHVSGSTKCWDVTVFYPDCESPRGRIVVGWKKFVQDHGLHVGDVCVFELVPGTKKMNVTIYSF